MTEEAPQLDLFAEEDEAAAPSRPEAPPSPHEINWGFSAQNSTGRGYLELQNRMFAQAMLKAGYKPYIVRGR